jgi:nickel transport system permease protein
MKQYILKRLLFIVPLLIGISFVSFSLMSLSPSDPAEVTLRVNDVTVTPEALVQMRQELGLDKPWNERYILWFTGVLHGDFGLSYATKTPVMDEILHALPTTLTLALITLILVLIIGFGLGIVCALYEGSMSDKIIRFFIFISTAMPSFWLGLLLVWFFAFHLNLLPTSGFEGMQGMILPAITLSLNYISTYARMMRNTMIQTKEALFVLYAKARGLRQYVINGHIIKNAIHPCIVALGMSIPKLVAGTVVVENIFGLPGIGRVCVHAIFSRDYPMIQAYVLLMACLFIVFNLCADIFVRFLDPRLRRSL